MLYTHHRDIHALNKEFRQLETERPTIAVDHYIPYKRALDDVFGVTREESATMRKIVSWLQRLKRAVNREIT